MPWGQINHKAAVGILTSAGIVMKMYLMPMIVRVRTIFSM